MDTELLREYRTIRGMRQELMTQWLSARFQQMGMTVELETEQCLRAAADSGVRGPVTVLCAAFEGQETGCGREHVLGHDAACAMLLRAVSLALPQGLAAGRLAVVIYDSTAYMPEREETVVEIGLARRDMAGLGRAVCCRAVLSQEEAVYGDCVHAVKEVLGTSGEGPAAPHTSILVGADPVPELGVSGMEFHKLALENGADILRRLIAIRHQS